jgi:hypothetical protein
MEVSPICRIAWGSISLQVSGLSGTGGQLWLCAQNFSGGQVTFGRTGMFEVSAEDRFCSVSK